MIPSIRQLEYAVALAETLSFRKAAERCHVTQPGLSSQIQQLEGSLGIALFERDRRHVFITEAGEQLIQKARKILSEVNELVEVAESWKKPLSGNLRLGVIPTIAPYLLPSVLTALKTECPSLHITIREGMTSPLCERLARGELDVLIVALEADLGDLESTALFRDPFVLVTPKDHPLAKKAEVTQDDLSGDEILLLDDGHCFRDQTLEICDSVGTDENLDARASNLHTLVRLVYARMGITFIPQIALKSEIRPDEDLVARRLTGTSPARTIALAWRKSTQRGDEFRHLEEIIRNQAATMLGDF